MNKLIKFVIIDIIKNRIVLFYTLVLLLFTFSVFGLEDNESKGVLTLLNVILIIVPLFSILFSTIYIYNSSEFVELLVSHPIKRKNIWNSLFLGLSFSLVLAFILGAGIPILYFVDLEKSLMMVTTGLLITIIYTSMALLCSILTRDKAKGIGLSILLWLYFSLLYDGLVLFLMFQFSDYPIETSVVVISALNPIDLARILILLKLEVSAMMGYTGAIFNNFFGTFMGLIISFSILVLWIFIPYFISLKKFIKKDL